MSNQVATPTSRKPTKENGDIDRLVEQLEQLDAGGAWHGPSLGEALEGVDAAAAARRPVPGGHSIWELVHHLRVTNEEVRRRLTGESASGEAEWAAPGEMGPHAWREELERLRAGERALRDAVAKLAPSRLHEPMPGKVHSYWYELLGVLHHDAYHTGQISLLKKREAGAMDALPAAGRSDEIPESHDVYGWLIGSWDLDVLHYLTDVRGRGLTGEAHFSWVLEGRAVQDVWIMPRRADRTAAPDRTANMFGTTLRVWDPSIQAWRVTWINPVTGARDELVGRRVGEDVVQVGRHADGTPIRWSFTEVTPDSFHWLGEVLEPDGRTWTVQGEFRARRSRG
jgi:uncharacterized damage-inducible protein DinB